MIVMYNYPNEIMIPRPENRDNNIQRPKCFRKESPRPKINKKQQHKIETPRQKIYDIEISKPNAIMALVLTMLVSILLRILTGKKHPKIKLQHLPKYEYGHVGHWYIKLTYFKRF